MKFFNKFIFELIEVLREKLKDKNKMIFFMNCQDNKYFIVILYLIQRFIMIYHDNITVIF